MWYIHTMEYYSAIERNETGSFVETWMELESVIQSEVSQKEKNKYSMTVSRSIHVSTNDPILFPFMAE